MLPSGNSRIKSLLVNSAILFCRIYGFRTFMLINVGKPIINNPPNHHFYRWYVYHSWVVYDLVITTLYFLLGYRSTAMGSPFRRTIKLVRSASKSILDGQPGGTTRLDAPGRSQNRCVLLSVVYCTYVYVYTHI